MALVCGNTSVIKPSERDPGAVMFMMKLAQEAGIPDGAVNVIHGSKKAVNFVLDNPTIKAVSFVGSDQAVSSPLIASNLSYFNLFFYLNKKISVCLGPIYLRTWLS